MLKRLTIYILALSLLVLAACEKDDLGKTRVDDISDEVYEELVEWYFFYETQKIVTLELDLDSIEWYKDTPQYEQAAKNAENYKARPEHIFPNDLYLRGDDYTETENYYMKKLREFDLSMRVYDWDESGEKLVLLNEEEYEELRDEIKEGLKIKDSDDMFGKYIE